MAVAYTETLYCSIATTEKLLAISFFDICLSIVTLLMGNKVLQGALVHKNINIYSKKMCQ